MVRTPNAIARARIWQIAFSEAEGRAGKIACGVDHCVELAKPSVIDPSKIPTTDRDRITLHLALVSAGIDDDGAKIIDICQRRSGDDQVVRNGKGAISVVRIQQIPRVLAGPSHTLETVRE
jgi:hypothetical protein